MTFYPYLLQYGYVSNKASEKLKEIKIMNNQPETIVVKFDASDLPRWAQNDPAVVNKCKNDLAFRCNVHDAKTATMKALLKKEANR